ncbi:hypothetical protein [Halorussus salinus]|uniref:hypothetical protein n=1 Tax=Halorussus salinus TaxID=1364935 RepID=UPI0010925573|nr:hypothetical protein [Halorussus salinus]
MVSVGFRIAFCLLVLLGAPLAPLAAGQAHTTAGTTGDVTPDSSAPRTVGVTPSSLQSPPPTNNSSVRHESREELAGPDERAALSQWFGTHLSSQLGSSVIKLDQGEYEQARSLLGDDYNTQLGRYVDVAGETAGTADDQTADRLKTTQENQADYVESVQEYRETYRDYVAAKQAGNETAARTHARELNSLANQIQQTGGNLTTSYRVLGNRTNANLTQGQQTVDRITENITTQQTTVRRETFVNTTLTLKSVSTTASILDPLQVHGRLAATNGTVLADRHIVMQIGARTIRTRTTTNGQFTLSLRPTLLAEGEQSLSVHYRPRTDAVYLGSNDTATVRITQQTPTVQLTGSSTTVAYNETVTVHGRVHVQNQSVGDGVPVRITVEGTSLTTAQTKSDGTFTATATLPPGVPAGEQDLRVALPLEGRALRAANTTTSLRVQPTETRLTLRQSTSSDTASLALHGVLTTASGAGVPNQAVQLRVGGQTITTATTNQTGHYRTQLDPEALRPVAENPSMTVTAVYPGPGNLQSSQAQTTVSLPAEATGSGTGLGGRVMKWLSGSPWIVVLGGLVVAGLGGLALWRYFGEGTSDTTSDTTTETGSEASATETASDTPTASTQSASQSLHDQAESLLEAGETDTAVQAAYTAVRQQATELLALNADQMTARTYWEFYHLCRSHDAISESQAATLKHLTEYFEAAQFSPTQLSADRADEAIAQATTFLSELESSTTPTSQTDGGRDTTDST